ncbi:MAG TPA: hypothetical protein VII94_04740, partial [Candidatus Saccharimonadales bacterium]
VAGKFKKIDAKLAVLYFITVAMIGVFGEIFLDTFYNHFVGHPLWHYNILPIQHAYTSKFAIVAWGTVGFYLYLMHDNLANKWTITKTRYLSLIFSLEALILEALFTLSAKIFLGRYIYYYIPGDLWHVSSFQNIPFYFICGILIVQTIKRFKKDPYFFTAMSACLITVLIYIAK